MSAPNSYKDPFWSNLASSTEAKLGLPLGILVSVLTNGERSNNDQVSEANAKTPFQIIPATQKAAIKKYGIDPYLSADNAAEVAGLLLKDSLDRNGGSIGAAVSEYHGGTDRKQWGPRTQAYAARVLSGMPKAAAQATGPISAPAVSPEGTTFDRLMAQQPKPNQTIAKIYDAYKNGVMSAEDAQAFEDDVNSGKVLLPRGGKLNTATEEKQSGVLLPQEITNAYTNGLMSPEDKASLEADMKAGLVRLPPTLQSQIPTKPGAVPPTEQGVIVPPTGPSLGEAAIGAGEAALSTVTGLTSGAVGMVGGTAKGLVDSVQQGTFGTPEGVRQVEQMASQGAQALTYEPRTESGQSQVAAIGQVMQNAIPLAGVAGEMASLAKGVQAAKPIIQATGERIISRPVAPTVGTDIARNLQSKIDSNFSKAVEEYAALPDSNNGQIINTDIARELSPEYRADRTRSAEVHEPASAFAKRVYAEKLAAPTPEGKSPVVLFTGGGTGAGKSTGLKLLGDKAIEAEIIYDTNMNTFESANTKIKQALNAGREVAIVYTYRDPVEAMANGALPRAERMGRTVPIENHIETHLGSRAVIEKLVEAYKDDSRVDFSIIDNSKGRNNAHLTTIDKIPKIDENGLKGKLNETVQSQYEAGTISEATRNGTIGNTRATVKQMGAGDSVEPKQAGFGKGTAGAAQVETERLRIAKSENLPVPIELTKGAASRDAAQLAFEKEQTKGAFGAPLRNRIEENNLQALQNFDVLIDRTNAKSPDVANSGAPVVKALSDGYQAAKNKTNVAYTEARKSPEASIKIDPNTTVTIGSGDNTISTGLIDYLNSVPNNLKTTGLIDHAKQYAVRLGVAAKNEDGTLSPVPTNVKTMEALRKEISQATGFEPIEIRDSTILKKLIDANTEPVAGPLYKKARALREQQARKYENRAIVARLVTNRKGMEDPKVYAEQVFQKSILNAQPDEITFLKRVLLTNGEAGKQAWQEMQGAMLNYIKEESTKGMGMDSADRPIVSPAKLNQVINTLDKTGRLDLVLGKTEAGIVRDLNDVVKYVNTVPPGTLINSSGTAGAIVAAITEAGATGALTGLPLPVLSILKALSKTIQNAKVKAKIENALNAKPKEINKF